MPSLLACSELPPIEASVCGNGVVELGNGEECDTFADDGAVCRAPGSVGECRFDCSATPCPSGYACGTDDICRASSLRFEHVATGASATSQVQLADMDGDGRADLLAESARGIEVIYAGEKFNEVRQINLERGRFTVGKFQSVYRAPTTPGVARSPSTLVILDTDIANLAAGKASDNAATGGGGLNVYRGSSDRRLLPTLYPTIPVNANGLRLSQGRMTKTVGQLGVGSDAFAFTDVSPYAATRGQVSTGCAEGAPCGISVGHYAPELDGSTSNRPLLALSELDPYVKDKSATGRIAVSPVSGKLVERYPLRLSAEIVVPLPYPCDTLAWSELGEGGAVSVMPLCHLDKAALDLSNPPQSIAASVSYEPNYLPDGGDLGKMRRTVLRPPAGVTITGTPTLRDVPRYIAASEDTPERWEAPDGALDVLVPSTAGMLVAHGDGVWTIADPEPTSLIDNAERALTVYPGAESAEAPLAFGDFNGDGMIDWVDSTAIHFHAGKKPLLARLPKPLTRAATAAVSVDLDRDGVDDLIVGGEGGYSVFRGTNNPSIYPDLNRIDYALEGRVKLFSVGDFDGDGNPDFITVTRSAGRDFASIAYGARGFPTAPEQLGNLKEIDQVVALRFSWLLSGVPDGIDSVLAGGTTEDGVLAGIALQGKANRQINSRFSLTTTDAPLRRGVALSATTGHFSGAQEGLMLLGSAVDVSRDNPTGNVNFYVYHAPTVGDAQLTSATVQASLPLVTIQGVNRAPDYPRVAEVSKQFVHGGIGAGDLDGDGYDDAIAALPKSGDTLAARLLVATATTDITQASSTAVGFVDATLDVSSESMKVFGDEAGAQPLRVLTGDVDQDGHVDVLVVRSSSSGLRATVFFGDGSKQLSTARALTFPELGLVDLAVLPDGKVLGLTATHLQPLRIDRSEARWDGVTFVHNTLNPNGLAVGDVDGDGVLDVAISSEGGFVVARGQAVLQ